MKQPDFAIVSAGQLLISQLVDHDPQAVRDLIDGIDDLDDARNVMITLLIMADKLLEPNDTLRRQAISGIVANFPPEGPER